MVEFSCEAVWTWAFVCWKIFDYSFNFRACDGSVKILYFFLVQFWKVEIDCQGHRDLRNEDLILKEAEEQVGICEIIPRLFKFLKRRRERRSHVWHVYTALFKVDNPQRPPVAHRELCSVFYDNLNGQRIWRINTCVYIMWNWHNIVNELCLNIKYKVKKKIFIRQLNQSTMKSVPDDPGQGHLHLIYWINICWLFDFFFIK